MVRQYTVWLSLLLFIFFSACQTERRNEQYEEFLKQHKDNYTDLAVKPEIISLDEIPNDLTDVNYDFGYGNINISFDGKMTVIKQKLVRIGNDKYTLYLTYPKKNFIYDMADVGVFPHTEVFAKHNMLDDFSFNKNTVMVQPKAKSSLKEMTNDEFDLYMGFAWNKVQTYGFAEKIFIAPDENRPFIITLHDKSRDLAYQANLSMWIDDNHSLQATLESKSSDGIYYPPIEDSKYVLEVFADIVRSYDIADVNALD